MVDATPKVFISYTWTSDQHGQWVIELATQLVASGIDVIFDKWDLKEGHDVNAFMEQMASDTEIRKVIIVSNRRYAEKADNREGGVGVETQIITPEIYSKAVQDKFVAVVTERDESNKPYLPVYYKGRRYVDLGDLATYATNFERVVRWVFNKPLDVKPPLGAPPSYITNPNAPSLGTTAAFTRALDAIKNSRPYRVGAVSDYFERLGAGFENLRIADSSPDFDDKVVASINDFLPYRNEAVQIFLALAQHGPLPDEQRNVRRFLEHVFPYMYNPPVSGTFHDWDFDNFRFIIHELFLYLLAAYLTYERFEAANQLFVEPYYVGDSSRAEDGTVFFASFWDHAPSLDRRNERLQLRRICLRADLLKERVTGSGLRFHDLMQADFTAFMRDCVDSLSSETRRQRWWPDTLVYAPHLPLELYARARTKTYFDRVKVLLGVQKKADLEPVFAAFHEGKLHLPQWDFRSFANPANLLGYERLATLA